MRAAIIRTLTKVITRKIKLDNGKINIPDGFEFYERLPPSNVLEWTIKCYEEVFRQWPWHETWTDETVKAKIVKDMEGNSFLTIMKGDEEFPIAGFSWGSIVEGKTIPVRIAKALQASEHNRVLKKIEKLLKGKKVLYFDELAVLQKFRGGVNPLRFLTIKGFEKAWKEGVKSAIFWSHPSSKIVPIMKMMGFRKIGSVEVKEKEITFLFTNDFIPVLKIAKELPQSRIIKFMKGISAKS